MSINYYLERIKNPSFVYIFNSTRRASDSSNQIVVLTIMYASTYVHAFKKAMKKVNKPIRVTKTHTLSV